MSVALYLQVRDYLLEHDPDAAEMVRWSREDCRPPQTGEDMASEVIWIILCAGKTAQAARTIERKVWAALEAGTPVLQAFGHRMRATAIERAWREREHDLANFRAAAARGPAAETGDAVPVVELSALAGGEQGPAAR
jgi:hypothetical protein